MKTTTRILWPLIAIFLVLARAHAETPPLPPEPYIKRLPNYAQWQLDYAYGNEIPSDSSQHSDSTEKGSEDSEHMTLNPPRKITVIRTGKIWCSRCVDIRGQSIEQWSTTVGPLVKLAGKVTSLATGMEGSFSKDDVSRITKLLPTFDAADFPDVTWISAKNYLGIQSVGGRQLYVFQDKEAKKTLWVDVKTQYPVRQQEGADTITLQLGPPPSSDLQIPTAFSNYAMHLEKLNRAFGASQ